MDASVEHLHRLYAETDDPWNFRTSAYETAKFDATLRALPRARYAHALELGCGNGELARRVAMLCDAYTGLDAVERPLAAAREALPHGRFVRDVLPCPLPDGTYDLILLSEILYFLDGDALASLAGQLDARWPDADIVAVTWLGPSGNALEGAAALTVFDRATQRSRNSAAPASAGHRIDTFGPVPENSR